MVENANKKIAIVRKILAPGITLPNATAVKAEPVAVSPWYVPVKINTKAVNVHTTTVSINGSNHATNPSETGCFVFAAECAIDAEPKPASLLNAAR